MIGWRIKRRPRRIARAALLAAAIGATTSSLQAQLSVTSNSTYVVDFDNTVPGVNNGAWFAGGFDPGATVTGRLDSNAWAVFGWNDGTLPFGGTQITPGTDFVRTATTSPVSTPGIYSFGITGAGRALGIQQGVDDWDPGTLTFRVKNDSAQSILGFDFACKIWYRNDQLRSTNLTLAVSQDDSAYTNVAGTNTSYSTPGVNDVLGFKSVNASATISALSVAPGGYFYLRWSGASSGAGSIRDEVALDDITLNQFNLGTPPNTLVWNSFPAGAWNTTPGNQPWLRGGNAAAFTTGDNAVFNEPASGTTTVTIDPAGVQPASIAINNSSNAYTFAGGGVNGGVTVIKNNAGAVTLANPTGWTGPLIINAGSVILAENGAAGGVMKIHGALTLATSNGARLDLKNNHLILTSSPIGSWNGTSYTGVTGWIASGRSGNSWTGSGIVTSQTLAANGNYTTLAVALASDVRPNTATQTALWSGQTITGSDVLVMYTYGGDANLDGKINIDDYIRIDNGIATALTGWSNGDFNYDGKINIDDYTTVIDANIGIQSGLFFTANTAATTADLSTVPEPLTDTLLLLPAIAFLRRRPQGKKFKPPHSRNHRPGQRLVDSASKKGALNQP